jgi:hypothetical protein
MTEYEDPGFEDDLEDISDEDIRNYVLALAQEQERRREAEADEAYDPWQDPENLDPFLEQLQAVQDREGRPLTSREIERYRRIAETTTRLPLDTRQRVTFDLDNDNDRREFMAQRMNDNRTEQPDDWRPAPEPVDGGEHG